MDKNENPVELKSRIRELESRIDQLEENEKRYKDIAEMIPGIFYEMDLAGNFTFLSPSVKKKFQFTDQDISNGINFFQMIPRENLKNAKERFKKVISGDEKNLIETLLISKNGKNIPVFIYHDLLKNDEGRSYGIRGFVLDVCTWSEIKEESRETKEKYFSLLESISDSVYLINRDWVHVMVNQKAADFTGLPKEKLVNSNLLEIFPGIEYTPFFKVFKKVMLTRKPASVNDKFDFPDGRRGWYEVSVYPVPEGILCISRDITPRIEAEMALKNNEKKLQELVENIPGGVFQYRFFKNGGYKVEFISRGVEKFLGKTVPDIFSKSFLEQYLEPSDREYLESFVSNANLNLSPRIHEFKIDKIQGEKWVRMIATPRVNDEEEIIWSGVFLDITDEKNASLELAHGKNLYKNLNHNITEMLGMDSREDLFKYIIKALRKEYPRMAVLVAKVSKDEQTAKLFAHDGIPVKYFTRFLKILGYDIFKKDYKINKDHYLKYKSGNLECFDKGFAEFLGYENFTSFLAKSLEKIADIPIVYAIGINNNEKLFGIVYLFPEDKHFFTETHYVEAFIKQSGLVMNMKIAEKGLKKSEERYRLLVENQGEGIGVTNKQEVFQFVNPAGEEIFGVEPGELTGRSLKEFLSPENYEKIKSETELRKKGIKSTYEIEITQPSGRRVQLLATITPQYDEQGNFRGSFGIFRDITIRKTAEWVLSETKEKLELALKSTKTGIWDWDMTSNKIEWYGEHAKLFGVTRQDFGGTLDELRKYIHPEDWQKVGGIVEKVLKLNVPFDNVYRIIKPDKSTRWMHSYGKLIRDEKGKPVKIIGTTQDITDEKTKNDQIIEKNQELIRLNTTKDKLFGIIGHDLKNPLGNINGFIELLHNKYDKYTDQKRKEIIGLIYQSSEAVTELLDNLINWSFSQRENLELHAENFDLDDLVQECIDLTSSSLGRKQISLDNRVGNTRVFGDKETIKTVIRNLLTNAIKFSYPKGKITIDAKMTESRFVIKITDTGTGMDTETKSNLFGSGSITSLKGTAGEKGTGLGLMICKDFIEKNKGKIWVESTPGKGSAFYFTLPPAI